MDPAIHQDDPDRTDELPQLDLAAYEAEFDTAEGDPLSRTDSWMAVGVSGLHTARISELEAELKERDAKLHVLRGQFEESNSKQPQLTGELKGILGKISELEARLHETEGANDSLKQQLSALEARHAELQHQAKLADAATELLNAERKRLLTQIEQLNSELNDTRVRADAERAGAQSKLSEVQRNLAQQEQLTKQRERSVAELQADLQRVRHEGQELRETVRKLESKLAAQLEAAGRISRSFADQAIRNDVFERELIVARVEIERLSTALDKQQTQASTIDGELTAAKRQIDALQERLGQRQHALDEALGTLKNRDVRLEELSAEIAARGTRIEILTAQKAEFARSLEQDRATLQQLREDLAARESELARSVEHLAATQTSGERLEAELRAREVELKSAETKLAQTEHLLDAVRLEQQTQTAQGARLLAQVTQLESTRDLHLDTLQRQADVIQSWEQKWQDAAPRMTGFEDELRKRDERITMLQSELDKLGADHAHVNRELDEHRGHIQTFAAQLNIKDQRIASLESELTAHSQALGVIRRDVDRIDSEHSKPPRPSAAYALAMMDDDHIVHLLNRKIMTLGRTEENDIPVHSSSVSRRHAKLLVGSNAVIVEDCGSTNGTHLNGRRIKRHVLRDNDVLMFGNVRFQFRIRKEVTSNAG